MLSGDACLDSVQPAPGGFWSNLLSTDFVPRAQCVGDRPEIIVLHTASDAAIALAYYSIPIALVYFLRRRRDIAFPWIFWLFAAFILACGTTHLFNIVAFWYPMYRLDGVLKAGTGLISMATACLLWPLIPRALALPSHDQLRAANHALEAEVATRRDAQAKLDLARADLERRVDERTAEINAANASLDIARRTAERKLAEIEALYASAPAGFCFLDSASRVVRANAAFAAILGVQPADLLGLGLGELRTRLGPDLHLAIDRAEHLAESTSSIGLALSAGPLPRHGLASVRPVRSSSGDLLGVSVVVQDTTERDHLHDQLRQSQKSEAIGQLASGIAHEINNALTAIYGYLSLGRASIESAHPAAAYLDQILVAAQQASSVTKSLLTFARRERSRREPVHIRDAVDRAATLLQGLLPAHIRLVLDLDRADDLTVLGDANQLQQVVLNLAINSRDAMPGGGTLTIRLAPATLREAPAVRITVADTGSGMTHEVVQRAFEPFFTTKARGQGTGLGLSVVHGIVRSHDGDIQVRSAPGEGTAIEIDLPCGSAAVQTPSSPPGEPSVPTSGTIILAEDNRTIRQMFAAALRQKGFSVVEASDGLEFMDHMAALATVGTSILAVILDIDMPGRTGTECLRLLRERGDQTPVVLISGGPIVDVVDPRVVPLPKPFNSSDLLLAIGQAAHLAPAGHPDSPGGGLPGQPPRS